MKTITEMIEPYEYLFIITEIEFEISNNTKKETCEGNTLMLKI